MWSTFFEHVDIKPENAHLLDGNAPDLEAECARYEALIQQHGGIELFLGPSRRPIRQQISHIPRPRYWHCIGHATVQ